MRDLRDSRPLLSRLWWAGVDAVDGRTAVRNELASSRPLPPDRIVAIGKAASSMAAGVSDHFGTGIPTLIVTKHNHAPGEIGGATDLEVLETAHPVPDERSVAAGSRLKDVVSKCCASDHLLVLVSGGASSLAELPAAGVTLDDIASATSHLLASGATIHEINRVRRQLSQLKGGGLLANFTGARITVLAISDVHGDDIEVIGSGIGVVPDALSAHSETRIVASNAHARNAAVTAAESLGLIVQRNEETLYGDVGAVAARLGRTLSETSEGIFIFGGESTVDLPPDPGRGGRNQHLAVMLSRELAIRNSSAIALVAGTDGTDGTTEDAGGWASGSLWSSEAEKAVAAADSGTYLDRSGALFTTGPTGTNVTDLVVAVA